MYSNYFKKILFFAIVLFVTSSAFAAGFKVQFIISETGGRTDTVYVGVDTLATDTINTNLGEVELPPPPPTGIFDARLFGRKGTTQYLGQGSRLDLRDFVSSAQVDTYRVKFQHGSASGGNYPFTISWDTAALHKYGTSWSIMDVSGGSLLNVNMFDSISVSISNTLIKQVYIIKTGATFALASVSPSTVGFGNVKIPATKTDSVTVTNSGTATMSVSSSGNGSFTVSPSGAEVEPSASAKFFITFSPTTPGEKTGTASFATNADVSPSVNLTGVAVDSAKYRTFANSTDLSLKPNKLKPKKGQSAVLPTVANWRDTVILRQGGKTGITLGISQSDKTLAKTLGWVRFKKGGDFGKFYTEVQTDSSYNAPFDTVRKSGASKKKRFVKEVSIAAKTYTNPLAQEFSLFKLNLYSSANNVTNSGLGSLQYVKDGSVWNNYTLNQIANRVDSVLTYYSTKKLIGDDYAVVGSTQLETLRKLLKSVNDAFTATIALSNGDSIRGGALHFSGKGIDSVSFLKRIPGKESEELINITTSALPEYFSLNQNYPNPFNPSTTISFFLSEQKNVTLQVYNMLGQEVATILNNTSLNEGAHEVVFDASRLSSGVYFYRLSVNGNEFQAMKKMLLLK